MRAVTLNIDLLALRQNFLYLRSLAGAGQVMPVVKANAYGHGAVDVARSLDAADAFAVAFLDEAAELRQSGIEKPILVLQGCHDRRGFKLAKQFDLWLVVHTEAQVIEAEMSGVDVPLWLKVDTGMGRLGISTERAATVLSRLGGRCVGLMSHFSSADMPLDDENRAQLERFLELSDRHCLPRSMANSAALIANEASRMDWVRPGIALYGGNPFSIFEDKPSSLQAVMTLEAPLAAVSVRREGSQIGYGGISTLERDTKVGVVSAGYADGYPRLVQPGTPVSVNGVLCPTLGRVSMDMVCVDLNEAPDAQAGDRVELWGPKVSVDTVAASAGTIAYELLCHAGTVGSQRGASN